MDRGLTRYLSYLSVAKTILIAPRNEASKLVLQYVEYFNRSVYFVIFISVCLPARYSIINYIGVSR